LEWNGDVVLSVHGVDELEQAIVELEGQALKDPFLVELFREDGASLSLGLGRTLTVLDYVPPDLDTPYFQSFAPDRHGQSLWFRFRGDLSEFPPDAAVDPDAGRRAFVHFFETGELSPELRWRET
jgi:hypothetical protein